MKTIYVSGNESGSNHSMVNNLKLYIININHIVSLCGFDYTRNNKNCIGTEINLINNTIFVEESMKQIEEQIYGPRED
jgi:hypothetical protein